MEPVDLVKLETAIKYVERIAEGNNPVNNLPMEEDAVLNNPNVIRCMYFVKGVLEEVRSVPGNTYLAVIYNQNAQEFVVRNLEKMVNGETEDDTEA